MEKHPTLPTVGNIEAYILRALRHQIIDEKRMSAKRAKRVDIPPEHLPVVQTQATQDIASLQQLEQLLSELSPQQQEILALRFYNNMPYKEIASIVGMQYQSVRNTVHRAFTKLRRKLEK